MGFSFTKGVILQEMSMSEFEASLNMAESCDRCITAGIGSNCERSRCPIARTYDARMLYFEAMRYQEKMKTIYRKAQQTKQRIAKAREQAAAAKEVK